MYTDDGNDGIEGYIAYVNQLYAWISKQREPKGAEGEVSAVSMQQEEHLQNQPETTLTTSDENN